jgi:hypothetical protein
MRFPFACRRIPEGAAPVSNLPADWGHFAPRWLPALLTSFGAWTPVAILPDHDGGTDHVGGTLLAFKASGHIIHQGLGQIPQPYRCGYRQ